MDLQHFMGWSLIVSPFLKTLFLHTINYTKSKLIMWWYSQIYDGTSTNRGLSQWRRLISLITVDTHGSLVDYFVWEETFHLYTFHKIYFIDS